MPGKKYPRLKPLGTGTRPSKAPPNEVRNADYTSNAAPQAHQARKDMFQLDKTVSFNEQSLLTSTPRHNPVARNISRTPVESQKSVSGALLKKLATHRAVLKQSQTLGATANNAQRDIRELLSKTGDAVQTRRNLRSSSGSGTDTGSSQSLRSKSTRERRRKPLQDKSSKENAPGRKKSNVSPAKKPTAIIALKSPQKITPSRRKSSKFGPSKSIGSNCGLSSGTDDPFSFNVSSDDQLQRPAARRKLIDSRAVDPTRPTKAAKLSKSRQRQNSARSISNAAIAPSTAKSSSREASIPAPGTSRASIHRPGTSRNIGQVVTTHRPHGPNKTKAAKGSKGKKRVGSSSNSLPAKKRQRRWSSEVPEREVTVNARKVSKWRPLAPSTLNFVKDLMESNLNAVLSETLRQDFDEAQEELNDFRGSLLERFSGLKAPALNLGSYHNIQVSMRTQEAACDQATNQLSRLKTEQKVLERKIDKKMKEKAQLEEDIDDLQLRIPTQKERRQSARTKEAGAGDQNDKEVLLQKLRAVITSMRGEVIAQETLPY